jgi:hypothetical protein
MEYEISKLILGLLEETLFPLRAAILFLLADSLYHLDATFNIGHFL